MSILAFVFLISCNITTNSKINRHSDVNRCLQTALVKEEITHAQVSPLYGKSSPLCHQNQQ